jgi:hypothetical protein
VLSLGQQRNGASLEGQGLAGFHAKEGSAVKVQATKKE